MASFLEKVPFLRLLIPLLGGIITQYYLHWKNLYIPLTVAALSFISLSFLISCNKQYSYRWLFGTGTCLFLLAAGIFVTTIRQEQAKFSFPHEDISYKGTIINLPGERNKSITCEVKLTGSNKKIICYLQKGIRSKQLKTGEEIMFYGKIKPFKNFGNPNDFDYSRYMFNKGFSGTIYLYSDDWEASGRKSFSLFFLALETRQKILNFYKTLGLDSTEFSILSALTLGYKDELPEEIKQSFRNTGTAHVLAVSGLHVGIIYGMIVSVLGLFLNRNRYSRTVQLAIILLLWTYAFITGLSPSVIRATVMLTIFCIGNILNKKAFTYNTVTIAAFCMLLYNPFLVFDLSFQLSFAAVLAILFFQPTLAGLLKVKNTYLKYTWLLFTTSLAAQLGTFPICLYHFGTFPTYFFITNLLIIPLAGLVIYTTLFTSIIKTFGIISSLEEIYTFPAIFLKFLINLMTDIIYFFGSLPFANLQNLKVSLPCVFLMFSILISVCLFFRYKKPKNLVITLACIYLAILFYIHDTYIFPEKTFTIYQEENTSRIKWQEGKKEFAVDSIRSYEFIALKDKAFLSVSSDYWINKTHTDRFPIDYLHILNNDLNSLNSLTQLFTIKQVILDSSISRANRRKIISECQNLGIPYYDMNENGSFRIIF